jgi:ABC-type multidrug transport system fused ATPase/permease subunit
VIANKEFPRVLRLMTSADRRRYYLLGFAFCLTNILDVIGIYALSISILLLGSSGDRTSNLPNFLRVRFENFETTETFAVFMGLTAILFVVKSLLSMFLAQLTLMHLVRVGERISKELSTRFFEMPLSRMRSIQSVKVSHGLNYGINSMAMELLGSYLIRFGDYFLLIAILVPLCFYNFEVTLIMILYFSVIFVFLFRKMGARVVSAGNIRIEADVKGNTIIQNLINGYRDIFVMGKIDRVLQMHSTSRKDSLVATSKIVLSGIAPKYLIELSLVLALSILGVIGSFKVDDKEQFASSVVIFFAASSRLVPSILRIQSASNTIKTSSRASKFSFEVLDAIEESKTKPNHLDSEQNESSPAKTLSSEVVVHAHNVNFSHDGSGFTISSLNFEIYRGEFVAFVGRSGSGKSTIVDLIIGLLKQRTGKLLVNGVPPQEYIKLNPGAIGLVPQNIELFDCSVLENVALFEEEPNLSRVRECLKGAEALEFVDQLQEGVHTNIGERGLNLSGGQRQRIGIARALYRNPEILILDEATSALDAESERAIASSINNISKFTTVIVVAHRLSTVVNANRVFYWSSGELLATGSFEELRERLPEFAEQANILKL